MDAVGPLQRPGTTGLSADGRCSFSRARVGGQAYGVPSENRFLIYFHKGGRTATVELLIRPDTYVMIDDKTAHLNRIKEIWGERVQPSSQDRAITTMIPNFFRLPPARYSA